MEEYIIPSKTKSIDFNERQVSSNSSENSTNLTILSLQTIESEKAKIEDSLLNRTIHTTFNEEGILNSVYIREISSLVNDSKGYESDSNETMFEGVYRNITLPQFKEEELNDTNTSKSKDFGLELSKMENEQINLINLTYYFFDENKTIFDYFENIEYQIFNQTEYDNQVSDKVVKQIMEGQNITDYSLVSTTEIDEDNNPLRKLLEDNELYYGEKKITEVQEIFNHNLLGIIIKAELLIINDPSNGKTYSESAFEVSAIDRFILTKEETFCNRHILIKNQNNMAYDLIQMIQERNTNLKTQKLTH